MSTRRLLRVPGATSGTRSMSARPMSPYAALSAAGLWQDHRPVFCTGDGTPLDRHNALRDLGGIIGKAGLDDRDWTARELRHTFVSLLSDHGVSIEEISLLVGHDGTDTTERVYRHRLRPVRRSAAKAMDDILHDVG
ncbi:tyrosine-type recombinase/integrase [Nocardiopsis sp. RV163]|uniref:tyrosine-type recombinase/integrase n=1 Tax=Nocardiopsis sp. RV163 TaxID=1661388 RepID=UPI002E15807D